MSDDEYEVIIIGCDDTANEQPKLQPTGPTNDKYVVRINEFEKRKESFLGSEVQVYRVEVSSKGKRELILNRRFSDMELLVDVLRESNPGVILPGFPENTVYSFVQAKVAPMIQLGIFEKERFIGRRMQTLERFLYRLLNMKELAESEAVLNFLGPDEQYYLYRQSKASTLSTFRMHSEKKGIIGGALQTATNYFKTKRVDSKYEKFLEAGQAVSRDIEKLFTSVQEYLDLNHEELKLNASLHEPTLDLSSDPPTKHFFERWDGALETTNRYLLKLADLVHFMLLDARMYASVIEQRYELKEQNEAEQVHELEKNFEASKDNFLQRLCEELVQNRHSFQQIIRDQSQRLKSIQ